MIHLTVKSLMRRYGSNVVFSDLSFETGPAVLGIAGRNGSGKSTLLKCISGLLKPSSGTIAWKLNGNPVPKNTLRHNLGYAAPYISLYEELTVYENLKFILDIRKSKEFHTIDKNLSELECMAFRNNLYGSLSTGQQQRVRLAAALIHQPEILLLDEPGTNLDKYGRKNVADIADAYRNHSKLLILASNASHELDLCDSIIDLNST